MLSICLLFMALSIALIAGIWYPPPWYEKGPFEFQENAVILICGCALIVRGCATLYQFIFRRGEAVWIKNRNLIYLDEFWGNWFVKVPLNDIESVSLDLIGAFSLQFLVIRKRNGRKKSFRTWFLAESAESVLTSLKTAINQTS
jgi:hypothetical protein